jgi:hypothetical protein
MYETSPELTRTKYEGTAIDKEYPGVSRLWFGGGQEDNVPVCSKFRKNQFPCFFDARKSMYPAATSGVAPIKKIPRFRSFMAA